MKKLSTILLLFLSIATTSQSAQLMDTYINDDLVVLQYIMLEGSTVDDYQTIIGTVDPTVSDKKFTFPNDQIADGDLIIGTGAGTFGYVPMSGDATITNGGVITVVDGTDSSKGILSVPDTTNFTVAAGALSMDREVDLVATSPLLVNAGPSLDNVIPGTDADITLSITVAKDIVTTAPLTGAEDNVLPGADADLTLAITIAKDIVAGDGLSGGEDNVLPGADADVTLTVNVDDSTIETSADTLRVKADGINDTHIDFGVGANQVSAVDVPIADSGSYYIGTETETALQEVGILIPIIYDPTAVNFGDTNQEYDIDGETWVTSGDGTPDQAGHLLADVLTSIETAYDSSFFAIRELTGAATATNPLTVQFTWSSVTNFSTIKMRVEYDGSFSHKLVFEFFNGVDWDTFIRISADTEFVVYTAEVFNPADYIDTGTVIGRFRHEQSGNANHHLEIDYIVISSGGGGGGGALQTAIQTPFTATGDIAATNVQDAVAEVDSEKEPLLVNSAGLIGALDDETGTGLSVFNTAPTFETSITGNYLTASEILITGASKEIISAAVATYPSLAELAYVKGVTSAIQTQFSNILNGTTSFSELLMAGIIKDNDDMVFEIDADNDGSNKYSWTDGASAEIMSLSEAGLLTIANITSTGTITFQDAELEVPNSASDKALATAGEMHLNTTDEQLCFHSGADGEISGEVCQSLIRHATATFDPSGWYDQESTYRVVPLFAVGDDSPEGVQILEWKMNYVGGDPTTQLDADLICDTTPDWNSADDAVVMDVLDTTSGASSADTGFDIASCANASKMYIHFGADPTDANVMVTFDLWFYNEED